jgi:hypothetical protein
MLPSVPVQRKYLLLFNRQSRNILKMELIPTPSKLSDENVSLYFKKHMMAKDNYFVPKGVLVLQTEEQEYKTLGAKKEPKPRAPRAPKEKAEAMATMTPTTPMAMKSVIPPPPPPGSEKAMAMEKRQREIKALRDDANEIGKLFLTTIVKKPMTAALRKVAHDEMMKHDEIRSKLQKLGYTLAPLEKPKK